MIKCPKCNIDNSDGVKFCKGCGTLLNDASEEKIRCPNGHILDPTWTKCAYCGTDVSAINTTQEQASKQSTDVPISEARRKTIVENSFSDDDTFEDIPDNRREVSQKGKTIVSNVPYIQGQEQRPKLVGFLVSFTQQIHGQSFELREGRVYIGKDPSCGISIDDSEMSSEHGLLLYRREKFILEDRLSTNGTFVNDTEIDDKIILNNYDRIRMGKTEFILIKIKPD